MKATHENMHDSVRFGMSAMRDASARAAAAPGHTAVLMRGAKEAQNQRLF